MISRTDLTESKRAQEVPDERELRQIHMDVEVLTVKINEIDHLVEALQIDPDYKRSVREAIARAHQISRAMCEKPLNEKTMLWHCDMRGRLAEAWAIVDRELGLKHIKAELERQRTVQQAMIQPIVDTIDKWKKKELTRRN